MTKQVVSQSLVEIQKSIEAIGFHAYTRDNLVYVSTEYGDNAADYYGEYRGGYPWINTKLETFAEKLHSHWEWQNPGAIVLIED